MASISSNVNQEKTSHYLNYPMLPKMKEGNWGPYFPQYRSKKNGYQDILSLLPLIREEKQHFIWTTPCVRKLKKRKTILISLNISKDNHIWFELLDASENVRKESSFPQIEINNSIDILFELLHVSGKKENQILISAISQKKNILFELLHVTGKKGNRTLISLNVRKEKTHNH